MVDLMEDKKGNILDIIEDESEATDELILERTAITVAKGSTASDISITGAVGGLTAAIKDSSKAAYTKLHATISGDYDSIIISADSDAATGNYTVTLTDGASKTAVIDVTVVAS